jgi:uncharacterized protein (TIGR02246 family)
MKKLIVKSLCLLTILMFSLIQGKAQSDAELKAKIEKLNKEMGAAMTAGNFEKSLSFYTDDVISLPNNGKMIEGKAALKASNEEMMKTGVKITSFDFKTLKVMSYNKTITEIGAYQMSMSIPGKADPMKDNGKYLTIWEKQADGSLKIKVEMWNTDTNPMMGM